MELEGNKCIPSVEVESKSARTLSNLFDTIYLNFASPICKKYLKLTVKFFKLEKSLKFTMNLNVKRPARPLSPDPGSDSATQRSCIFISVSQ
jgi:hypothetical protein